MMPRYAFTLVLVWWVIVAVGVVVQVRRVGPTSAETVFDEDINDHGAVLRQRAEVSSGWASNGSPDGFALAAGRSGSVILRVDKAPEKLVRLLLWFYDSPTLTTSVACSSDGTRYQLISTDRLYVGTTVDLADCSRSVETVWVRLSAARDDAAEAGRELVLDKIRVMLSDGFPAIPQISPWLALGLLSGILWFLLCELTTPPHRAILVGGNVMIPATALWFGVSPQWCLGLWGIPVCGWWIVCGALLAIAWWQRFHRHQPADAVLSGLTGLWILGVSAAARWELVMERAFQPLPPDAITVSALAARMEYLYDTEFREPMWVWLMKLFHVVAGPSDLSSRLFSFACSVAMLAVVYAFVRRYFGSVWMAALVTALLGSHQFLVDAASQSCALAGC